MRWLAPSLEKTIIGAVFVMAFASLGVGCSVNWPKADGSDRSTDKHKSTDVAIAPEISADVPRLHGLLTDHARRVETPPSWVAIRTFTFDYDNSSIDSADLNKVAEISEYTNRNPALRIVIDGSVNPRGIDRHNRGLRDRRVEVVREALIAAGVSPFMIETGVFGTERLLGDRSIEVLVRTAPEGEQHPKQRAP